VLRVRVCVFLRVAGTRFAGPVSTVKDHYLYRRCTHWVILEKSPRNTGEHPRCLSERWGELELRAGRGVSINPIVLFPCVASPCVPTDHGHSSKTKCVQVYTICVLRVHPRSAVHARPKKGFQNRKGKNPKQHVRACKCVACMREKKNP